jgi:hypothetical protein
MPVFTCNCASNFAAVGTFQNVSWKRPDVRNDITNGNSIRRLFQITDCTVWKGRKINKEHANDIAKTSDSRSCPT